MVVPLRYEPCFNRSARSCPAAKAVSGVAYELALSSNQVGLSDLVIRYAASANLGLARTPGKNAARKSGVVAHSWGNTEQQTAQESLKAGWCYIGQQKRYVRKRDGMLWELGDYTAAGAAPYTDAKGEMIEASASDLQSYMVEHAGEVPFSYRLVTVDEIIERLPRHVLPRQRVHATLYDVLRRRFNGIHVEAQIRPRGSKGDKIRVWAIGPTPEFVDETFRMGGLAAIYRDERASRSDDSGSDFADE